MVAEAWRSELQSVLQTAVQSVDWTYSLFWQRCPEQGILVWSDGYYNGSINTRKTTEPTEVTKEEAALRRSLQLRELYESLVAAEPNSQSRRPSATLSPEDLSDAEWFYLLSVSFSFRPGFGLPGKAYAKQKHIWLAGADEADSKICPRLILAKSAGIRTCVYIPILDGVVELGTSKWVEEDIGLIQDMQNLFNHSKPAISDQSTSTPSIYFQPLLSDHVAPRDNEEDESEPELGESPLLDDCEAAMPVDNRVGLQDDDSDSLGPDYCVLAGRIRPERSSELSQMQRWQTLQDPMITVAGISSAHEITQEDTIYSRTVSTLLQSTRWSDISSAAISTAGTSAFSKYSASNSHPRRLHARGSSQWALKYILLTVPSLHTKSHNHPTKSNDSAPGDPGENHVLAERRRREKMNERFVTLRSLVPFVTKMDKASILGDTIEYLKHLRGKIDGLEERTRRMEAVAKKEMKLKAVSRKMKKKRGTVEVSIIENDGLVEIRCLHREGLLIDVIQILRTVMIEVTAVQSSMENGVFAAELRAKVGESVDGRKPTILEVKRAINNTLYS